MFENLEVSPRETDLGPDVMADEVIYPEDLEYFDSEAESDVELADTSSIKSQDKPKLLYRTTSCKPHIILRYHTSS